MTEEDVAVQAALAASAVIEAGRPSRIRHKGVVDLVTETDEAAEERIREVLAHHTPDIPVMGEEGGGATTASVRWVVDPIDGTTNFVHGIPHVAVSIALEVEQQPVVGVVHDVYRGDTLRATEGKGAWCGGSALRVSEVRDLQHALCATGFAYDRAEDPGKCLALVRMALVHTRGVRRMGSAALDLAYIAMGRLDAYFEFDLQRWDCAAGIVIVQEAGGRVSPIPGRGLGNRPCPIASNPWVHDRLIALIEQAVP